MRMTQLLPIAALALFAMGTVALANSETNSEAKSARERAGTTGAAPGNAGLQLVAEAAHSPVEKKPSRLRFRDKPVCLCATGLSEKEIAQGQAEQRKERDNSAINSKK